MLESIKIERFRDRTRPHGSLIDPHRLAIADEVFLSDDAVSDLKASLGIESNPLANHLATMESVGLIQRITSQGLIPRIQPANH